MNNVQIIELENGMSLPIFRSENLEEIIDIENIKFIIDWLDTPPALNLQKRVGILMNPSEFVKLPNGFELTYVAAGTYSLIFRFRALNGQTVILKMQNKFQNEIRANYIEEYKRITQLKSELGEKLEEFGVRIPDYYMAGTSFSIREYIPGDILDSSSKGEEKSEAGLVIETIKPIILPWLDQKRESGDTYWVDAKLDFNDILGRPSGKNFIRTPDGEIYLIDPFIG